CAREDMTPGRRTVSFAGLDDVMPDVERLLRGHTTAGNWSVGQICQQLASTIRLTVDLPASTRHDPSTRFSAEQVDRIFETGMLPEGLPLPAALSAPEPLEDRAAADRLREAIAY